MRTLTYRGGRGDLWILKSYIMEVPIGPQGLLYGGTHRSLIIIFRQLDQNQSVVNYFYFFYANIALSRLLGEGYTFKSYITRVPLGP